MIGMFWSLTPIIQPKKIMILQTYWSNLRNRILEQLDRFDIQANDFSFDRTTGVLHVKASYKNKEPKTAYVPPELDWPHGLRYAPEYKIQRALQKRAFFACRMLVEAFRPEKIDEHTTFYEPKGTRTNE